MKEESVTPGVGGLAPDGTRVCPGEATEAAFPLGGIGTGNVSLGSRGEWRDWEIFNRPAKGSRLPNTYFAIWAREEGASVPVAKVLESRLQPPHSASHGHHPNFGSGLPRLERSVMRGTYPVVRIDFTDADLPVTAALEAYTPMIPLNEADSGIPGAVLTYRVHNPSNVPVEVTVAGSLIHPVGGIQYDAFGGYSLEHASQNRIDFRQDTGFSGLYYHGATFPTSDPRHGTLALTAMHDQLTYRKNWKRGRWFDELHDFWDDFMKDGRLTDPGDPPLPEGHRTDTGSLGIVQTLDPGQTVDFPFVLAWHFPNRLNGWDEEHRVRERGREFVRNHYAGRFKDAWDAAAYLVRHGERLERETYAFRDALFGSRLPADVLDAVSANMTVLRSTTCFRLEDGSFWGYEGTFDDAGSCPGNCTHVWNYAQTLAYLYPRLEQSMRRTEFKEETDGDGRMAFRACRRFGSEFRFGDGNPVPPAADGQLGAVMRVLRDWKLTGDTAMLRELWPDVIRALDYAFRQWDLDGDGVLDGE